ncbi:MAG: hypothetical protein ACD_11C00090G0013 [uncultured bacterium]|nr:MAG: hypothetical protein ACD_11C00090G0013 [uncultured bacterium]HBR71749.1 hypothetical protein [Candidatus Moranbacteria bacterium]
MGEALCSIMDGRRFVIGNLVSFETEYFYPAGFLGAGWTNWKGPIDGDGLSGEEDVDPRSVNIQMDEVSSFFSENFLREGERFITGEEKIRRWKEEKPDRVRLGGDVFHTLWTDYNVNQKNSFFEWLFQNFKIDFVDFLGQPLRNPQGKREGLYVCRQEVGGEGKWFLFHGWLDSEWRISAS